MEFLNKINLVGNEIADRIAKVSKNLQQNNSETVTIENHKEIPKTFISSRKARNY